MLLKDGTIGHKIVKRATDRDYLKSLLYKSLVADRRYKLGNLGKINPKQRKASTSVINFYSGTNNIGDIIPVLGMQEMLGYIPDSWSMLDNRIDFDFVNRNYKAVIVGGAGLFDIVFEPFWTNLLEKCELPIVIWGVGITADVTSQSYIKTLTEVAKKCDLVNVRDHLTAELFDIKDASITACPSIIYLQNYNQDINRNSDLLLYSSHEPATAKYEKKRIKSLLDKVVANYMFTDHMQYSYLGLEDIIRDRYCNSQFVLTTRLHGAIIAYGLGIPYLAINRAPKTQSFVDEYGNGIMIDDLDNLESLLIDKVQTLNSIEMKPVDLSAILDFGKQVKQWATCMSESQT